MIFNFNQLFSHKSKLFRDGIRENRAIQFLKINRNQKFVDHIRKDLNKCSNYIQALSLYAQANCLSDKKKNNIYNKFKIPNYVPRNSKMSSLNKKANMNEPISTSEVQINLSDSSDSSLTPIDESVSSFLNSASRLVESGKSLTLIYIA